jgi:hypothetical protein
MGVLGRNSVSRLDGGNGGQVLSRPNDDTILAPDRRSGRLLQVRTTLTTPHDTASQKLENGQRAKIMYSANRGFPRPAVLHLQQPRSPGRGFPQVQIPRAEDDGTRCWLLVASRGPLAQESPARLVPWSKNHDPSNFGAAYPSRRRALSAASGTTSTTAAPLAPRTRSPMLDDPEDDPVMSRDQRPASTPAASPHIRSGNMHPRAVEHV